MLFLHYLPNADSPEQHSVQVPLELSEEYGTMLKWWTDKQNATLECLVQNLSYSSSFFWV